MEKSFTITVPPLACSFPWKVHPESLRLKELSDAWLVERFKHMSTACKSERAASFFSPSQLVDTSLHFLTMLFFGNSSSSDQLLLATAKLMSWYFMLDNFLDDPNEMGADPVQAKHIIDSVVSVFNSTRACIVEGTPHQGEDLSHLHTLMDSAKEWWEELSLFMTPSQQARFKTLFVEYLYSNYDEVCIRASSSPPDLQTYMRIRRSSIGWDPLPVVTECALGIELDNEVLTHPLHVLLKENVREHILRVNDIISFGKEYMQGDMFNVVFVLCFGKLLSKEPSYDLSKSKDLLSKELLQEAMEQVSSMIKERDSECVRIMEEMRSSPLLRSKPGLEPYLQGLGLFVGGNVYWHHVSARYGLVAPLTPDEPPNVLIAHHLQLSSPTN